MNSISVSIQNTYPIIFRILLSSPSTLEAPYFKRKNITNFLETFDNLYNKYLVNKVVCLKKIIKYYKTRTYKYI